MSVILRSPTVYNFFIFVGRKNVQTRLVQPLANSVNSGDVFILLSKTELYLFQGKKSNIIEKARVRNKLNMKLIMLSFVGQRYC